MDPLVGLFDPDEDKEMPESLPPEVETGNVEYKLKLVNPSAHRFEHLVTQMKWRLEEGQGEAIYEIGVEDSGMLAGLTEEEMQASIKTLSAMAHRIDADISVLREKIVDDQKGGASRKVAEVLVRKVPEDQQFIDLRLAVLGNVDAGKSTLLGVLTQGERDNGRGRARLNLFRHLHEIQSGRTSSISHEILGFNSRGEVVNYSGSGTAAEICANSSKVIMLLDLCGHQKYLKTTIMGLTGYSPDFAMLVVSASTGIVGTTKEHLGFALALRVPIFVVVSKIDLCRQSQLERTVRQLETLIKSPGCKRVPFRVQTEDDAVTAASTFHHDSDHIEDLRFGDMFDEGKADGLGIDGEERTQSDACICPIFTTSSVTRQNLHLLTKFLNVLPPLHNTAQREQYMQEHSEHQVDVVYSVSGVGTVVGGPIIRGTIKEGETLHAGPTDDGQFYPVTINSIHRNRLAARIATAGQAACLSLGHLGDRHIRKGMVLLCPELRAEACIEFEADIYLLFHTHHICKGFQTVVHVGNVCQTAKIIKMNKPSLQTNQKAVVIFRFNNRPEYIKVGSRLIFREGRTKGMGEVTCVFPYEHPNR